MVVMQEKEALLDNLQVVVAAEPVAQVVMVMVAQWLPVQVEQVWRQV
jgi:hypothetical protein